MAATTVTGQEILFLIAEEAGEMRTGHITAVTSTTQITVATDFAHDSADTYKYALIRILGKGISVVQSSTTGGVLVVSPAFTSLPVAGEVAEMCWWNGRRKGEAIDAMNSAVRVSYPYFYQETIVDQSTGTTLSASDDTYDLPAGCDALIAVGIQLSSSRPIRWFGPYTNKRKTWSIEGQRGAYTLRFHQGHARVAFHEQYATQKLCLWYATREPELTALSSTGGTTQLPLQYFLIGAEILRRRKLNDAIQRELQTASVNLPQLQQAAQAELQRLQVGKRPPNLVMVEMQTDNAIEIGLAMGMTLEEIAAGMPKPKKN